MRQEMLGGGWGTNLREAVERFLSCPGIAFLLLCIFLHAGFESYPFSSYPWATYYAVKRRRPVKIDGDLSEWVQVKGFTMAQEKFFFVGQVEGSPGPFCHLLGAMGRTVYLHRC